MEQGPVFKVEDLKELTDKYLNQAAKDALQKKSTQMTLQEEDGKIFQCTYFGSRVLLSNVEKGVQKVAEQINKLADQGLIHSALTESIIKVDLAKIPGEELNCVVICYVLVPSEKYLELQKESLAIQAGEVPKSEDDLRIKLLDGEFLFNPRFSHSLFSSSPTTEEKLDKELNILLAILPPGTTVVSKTPCAVLDLNMQYEVRLYNPLLQDIKEVELQWTRSFARIADEIKEFNLTTGVVYKDIDGKRLFSMET